VSAGRATRHRMVGTRNARCCKLLYTTAAAGTHPRSGIDVRTIYSAPLRAAGGRVDGGDANPPRPPRQYFLLPPSASQPPPTLAAAAQPRQRKHQRQQAGTHTNTQTYSAPFVCRVRCHAHLAVSNLAQPPDHHTGPAACTGTGHAVTARYNTSSCTNHTGATYRRASAAHTQGRTACSRRDFGGGTRGRRARRCRRPWLQNDEPRPAAWLDREQDG